MSTNTLLESASISIDPKSKNRSLITLEPLQKGFGHTLGNALRRVLVSSLTGCAVVKANIKGALHEYATLEGVEEDVLTILLNLRESAFALTGSRDEVNLELTANEKGPVTLGAIQLPHDVEVVNPEHVIANLTQAGEFHMTLTVMRGQGERMAQRQEIQEGSETEEATSTEEVNTLHLNAIFNPIKRVSYWVERARVGERTDLDKLMIDLETNGTRTPESAIREAASVFLQQGLKVILDLKAPDEIEEEVEVVEVDPVLTTPIDALEFGPRAAKCLKSEGIYFIGDLITQRREDLLMTPNLGKRSLEEIEKKLEAKSLKLGTLLPDWPPAGLSYSEENEGAEEVAESNE